MENKNNIGSIKINKNLWEGFFIITFFVEILIFTMPFLTGDIFLPYFLGAFIFFLFMTLNSPTEIIQEAEYLNINWPFFNIKIPHPNIKKVLIIPMGTVQVPFVNDFYVLIVLRKGFFRFLLLHILAKRSDKKIFTEEFQKISSFYRDLKRSDAENNVIDLNIKWGYLSFLFFFIFFILTILGLFRSEFSFQRLSLVTIYEAVLSLFFLTVFIFELLNKRQILLRKIKDFSSFEGENKDKTFNLNMLFVIFFSIFFLSFLMKDFYLFKVIFFYLGINFCIRNFSKIYQSLNIYLLLIFLTSFYVIIHINLSKYLKIKSLMLRKNEVDVGIKKVIFLRDLLNKGIFPLIFISLSFGLMSLIYYFFSYMGEKLTVIVFSSIMLLLLFVFLFWFRERLKIIFKP